MNKDKSNSVYVTKYLLLIAMFYMTLLLAATVASIKIVHLGWFSLAGSTVIFPLTYVLSDVVTEVYGYAIMRRLIWYSVICGFVFSSVISFVSILPYPSYWKFNHEFHLLINNTWLFTIAATIGMLLGSLLNSYLLAKWKIITQGKHFWLRSIVATSLGELLHILIVYPVVFGFTVQFHDLTIMIISAYSYRVIYAIVAVHPAILAIKYLKSKEKLDVYDYQTNFNPFKVEF